MILASNPKLKQFFSDMSEEEWTFWLVFVVINLVPSDLD